MFQMLIGSVKGWCRRIKTNRARKRQQRSEKKWDKRLRGESI
jgi:hypothetical protein